MVLWEIALGTAYFLGIKRTYRLAFKIQRRVISRKHPRLQQFVQRRTRAVFDLALTVHKNIQHRDLEVGRNLGNWILRWLDKMKPMAEIRAPTHQKPHHDAGKLGNMNIRKQVTNSSSSKALQIFRSTQNRDADRHLFSSSTNMWSNSFSTIAAMMMRPPTAAGNTTQCRHLCIEGPDTSRLNYSTGKGVIRKDIMQWMVRK